MGFRKKAKPVEREETQHAAKHCSCLYHRRMSAAQALERELETPAGRKRKPVTR